jgi:DNA repair protein RadC
MANAHEALPKIKDVHRVERPREKLLRYGPEKLSQAELLAILLGSGGKGMGALEVSRRLLKKFPDASLAHAGVEELTDAFGLGEAKACEIVACFELGKRLLKDKKTRLYLDPKDVWESLKDIRDNKKEHFVIFYLDTRHQEIVREIISVGTLNANLVHPREVFEPAVRHLAAQLIIAHNHPSGTTDPSLEDFEVTRRLAEAGRILGIEVIDHVIVTCNDFLSMKERGLL